MNRYLPEAEICIVEQEAGKDFNRAKLLNYGASIMEADYYCFHDVDQLPVKVDYSYPENPTQLLSSTIQRQYYCGGVTMFNRKQFELIDGYSNNFYGYGGEDNEMFNNLSRHGLPLINRFGVFKNMDREKKKATFVQSKWEQAQRPRFKDDGLKNCDCKMIDSIHYSTHLHLLVTV